MRLKRLLSATIISVLLLVPAITASAEVPLTPNPLPAEHWDETVGGDDELGKIHVHTPVISPVSIRDEAGNTIPGGGAGTTQLVSESGVEYQLRLDNDYVIHWEGIRNRPDATGYEETRYPNYYDKYTEEKFIKFPFEVLYDGVFYELTEDGGQYTEWIQLKHPNNWADSSNVQHFDNGPSTSENHWVDTPFYIPSYALETVNKIKFKVYAINSIGDWYGDHTSEEEYIFNNGYTFQLAPDGAKYVATFEVDTQTSGYIYNFTITGTNNGAVYSGENIVGSNEYSFALHKEEKKAGTTNRIGESVIRYLIDGTIAPRPWSTKNTITLTDAKSPQFTKQGAAWKGQTFSFCVKTIANLWDMSGDRIEIRPTFTFYDINGNKRDMSEIKVYYHNPYGSGEFIEYGTARDTASSNKATTYIGQKMNEGAYYTIEMSDIDSGGSARRYHYGNWDGYTADKYGTSKEVLLNRKVSSYCLSQIRLNSELRLYSGEYEELKWNIKGAGTQYEGVTKYADVNPTGAWGFGSYNVDRFRKSIQTWYGSYYVPADLFIVDLTKHPGFTIEDYLETANGGLGIRDDDPIFEQGGYLIVNFDIVSYNNGSPHLRYKGGSSGGNMWDTENFPNPPDTDDPNSPPIPGYDDGDVIVIDIGKSTKDKYSAGIHNIN